MPFSFPQWFHTHNILSKSLCSHYDVCTSNFLLTPGHNDSTELSLVDQYFKFADGRDDGLTGRGYDVHNKPGIDPDDPDAWDDWFFHSKSRGGHPWEVCRGGNSTHVDLFVCNDQSSLDFEYRLGKISESEYEERKKKAGYYFEVAGNAWNRACEAINFYIAIKDAGLPVVIQDGDALLSRFEGKDFVGIVPHGVTPKYSGGLFPSSLGTILDFRNIYDEDIEKYWDQIQWLPEEKRI